MFSTVRMLAVFVGLGLPAGLVLVPWTFLTQRMGALYWAGQRICYLGLRAGGIRFQVTGREHIPTDRPCIFMPNHVSNLDPPALIPMLPGTPAVMLKSSLMRIPILGPAMRLGKFVPVERNGDRRSAVESARAAAAALAGGLSLLIFVEGTRSPTGRLQAFKRGPFHLAASTGSPIVPIAISGTERMMSKGSVAVTPGTARLQFLPPVDPADYPDRNDLMRTVRERITAALPEHMRPLEGTAA